MDTACGDVVLDCWIKTQDGWVAGVQFICKKKNNRACLSMESKTCNMNGLHNKLSCPLKDIAQATGKAIGLKVTSAC